MKEATNSDSDLHPKEDRLMVFQVKKRRYNHSYKHEEENTDSLVALRVIASFISPISTIIIDALNGDIILIDLIIVPVNISHLNVAHIDLRKQDDGWPR